MQPFNILTRRGFLDRSFKLGLGVALSTLVDIPFVMKRALAEGSIGLNGNKLLFIFLRGANDALNSVIPIQDSAYNATNRPNILIPKDGLTDYSVTGGCDFPTNPFFTYAKAIRLGNGFAALHPSLKYLAPVYNAGELSLIHRVGYPNQSRSHFDSQNYWENGNPNNNLVTDGIFYRTMIESGLASTAPLTGVSVQSALPLSLRGQAAAMTNLTDPTRYALLGIPNTVAGGGKADNALLAADTYPFPDKRSRELLSLQYQNLTNTLNIFAGIDFTESGTPGNPAKPGNYYLDDSPAKDGTGYYLFPTTNAKNGDFANGNDASKYVVDTGAYSLFTNLKAAALILNNTDAVIAGTEFSGFDTHNAQGSVTGAHANLQLRIAWAMYALRKYFLRYSNKATWDNVIVITLSEFGRTTIQNASLGTDHAEAGVMFAAGGAIKGYNNGHSTGVFGCSPNDSIPWVTGQTGSMFGVNSRYLRRTVDYRSVLGEIIRKHLGATQNQLNRIIPGYANPGEQLLAGGTSSIDGTPIIGEVGIL
jgi:uncharacterized protein (DUF1501 family)